MSPTRVPLVPILGWTNVSLLGRDARSFLNKFCTADLKSLPVGQAQELMLLNPKGQVLSWGAALGGEDGIHLWMTGLKAEQVIQHLDTYLFSEDVRLTAWDVATWLAPLTAPDTSAAASPLLSSQLPASAPTAHPDSADEPTLWTASGAAHVIFAPSNLPPESLEAWWQTRFPDEPRTVEREPILAAQTYHKWRIQQRLPMVGQDTVATSLAQELLRDSSAISFTKGCYLGQETVARLDAMGHVNWNLRHLQLQSAWPSPQTDLASAQPDPEIALWLDDQAVGHLTSVCGTAALVRIRAAAAAQLLAGRCPDLQFRSANHQPLPFTALALT